MDAGTYGVFPPRLSPEHTAHLTASVKSWAVQHGLVVKPPPSFVSRGDAVDPHGCLATNAPVTLFPSLFPQSCYETAQAVQTAYNELYAAITNDEEWLRGVIEEVAQVDDFVAKLWGVHTAVKEEAGGYAQDLSVGLFRSDYIAHRPRSEEKAALKQVEFNTIAASFAGLSAKVAALHTALITDPGSPYPERDMFLRNVHGVRPPENRAVQTLAAGLAAAHAAYGPNKAALVDGSGAGAGSEEAQRARQCVLFVVQDGERNVYDQLALSSELRETHHIPVFYTTTTQLLKTTSIPADNAARPLLYRPPYDQATWEVTTVYLRSFYGPADYPEETAWAARLHLERSAAIKCPSVLGQLAGCKKVQQHLADPAGEDHLSRFLDGKVDKATVELVRATFAPQYDLRDGGPGRELALDPAAAERHVLKPQREGGGNNIYRGAIPDFLRSIPEREWNGYILMELIQPPEGARNTLLRSDGEVLADAPVIGELGVYGSILWRRDGTVLHNEEGGYLYRTKSRDSDEGGVAAGFSALDSILLM